MSVEATYITHIQSAVWTIGFGHGMLTMVANTRPRNRQPRKVQRY